jgi:hypothetical protein
MQFHIILKDHAVSVKCPFLFMLLRNDSPSLNESPQFLIRITRPWWHSLSTSFNLEDFPYKDCGFTVRFDFVLDLYSHF